MAQWLYLGTKRIGMPLWEALKKVKEVDFLDGQPSFKDLEGRELVIEAFPEEDRKEEVLRAVAGCREWQGTVASSIEGNSATSWAIRSGIGGRFVGFIMAPGAGKSGSIELLRGEITDPAAIDCVANAFKELDLLVTICRDQAGGILSRVLAGMINEAAMMAQNGIAPVDKIDNMMRLAANFPMGPFEWADKIGLDKLLDLLETLTKEFGPVYQPCPMIRRKVEAGKLGVKTGEGFYNYAKGDAK